MKKLLLGLLTLPTLFIVTSCSDDADSNVTNTTEQGRNGIIFAVNTDANGDEVATIGSNAFASNVLTSLTIYNLSTISFIATNAFNGIQNTMLVAGVLPEEHTFKVYLRTQISDNNFIIILGLLGTQVIRQIGPAQAAE